MYFHGYRVVLLNDQKGTLHEINLSRTTLKWFGVAAGILILCVSYFSSVFSSVFVEIQNNRILRKESMDLERQVQRAAGRIKTLEESMLRGKDLAQALSSVVSYFDEDQLIAKLHLSYPGDTVDASLKTETSEPENVLSLPSRDALQALSTKARDLLIQSIRLELEHQRLSDFLHDQENIFKELPFGKPTEGVVSAGFGVRRSILDGNLRMHEGLDISNEPGTPIVATADGTVRLAGSRRAFGRTVAITHPREFETRYSHLKRITVRSGQKVKRGQVIGYMGNTGRSSGVHLHYEVRVRGTPVDPVSFLVAKPKD